MDENVLSVLLVEDDETIRDFLKTVLESPKLNIYEAATCAEARQFLESVRFDVVLLDHRLPDGFGINLLPFACRLCPRVIMLTADADDIRQSALAAGATAVFAKSFEPAELLRCICQ